MSAIDPQEIEIRAENTPNPASVRFVLDRNLLEKGTADLNDAEKAERSPLAKKLFALGNIKGVFLGRDFVTVTAKEGVDWNDIGMAVLDVLKAHVASGETTLEGEVDEHGEGLSETAQGILRVIEEEIRPALAMDGGDCVFGGYEDGVVSLHLRGACHGCPSAAMTLKMGIERRLQEQFPEVKSVEAV